MSALVPFVEGEGDAQAVPLLLRRVLHERLLRHGWTVGRPLRVHGLGALRKKLDAFLTYAARIPNAGAILVLLDLDDGCAVEKAKKLAADISALRPTLPTAVVFAVREYEAWLAAHGAALAGSHDLPSDLNDHPNPERPRDAKAWLTDAMPSGIIYKETLHQAKLTSRIDLDHVAGRCRSFRRLIHAVDQITGTRTNGPLVTPA